MDAELQAKWGLARLARSPRRYPLLFSIFVFIIVFASFHNWLGFPVYTEHLSPASQIEVLARDTVKNVDSQSDTEQQQVLKSRWPVGALYVPKWKDMRQKMSSLPPKTEKGEQQKLLTPPVDEDGSDMKAEPVPEVYFDILITQPTVKLDQGIYVGEFRPADSFHPKELDTYSGIPFAQSTAGENRFRSPRPLPVSNKTFEATSPGPLCPAPERASSSKLKVNEDCLNLNVYRPAIPAEQRDKPPKHLLPVAIYVHGGAFNGGAADERDMASFVSWAKEDILGVSFNYRVGPLGFLPVDEWTADGKSIGELNVGLQDQRMLLEWVQDNIEAFGGDKDNVTVIGLSAGAHAIGHHLLYYGSPKHSKPAPFHRAILESGASTARAVLAKDHPRTEAQLREFMDKLGFGDFPRNILRPALRGLPVETLMKAASEVWDLHKDDLTWPFQPIIDGPGFDTPGKASSKSKTDMANGDTCRISGLPKHHHQHHHHSNCGSCASIPLARPQPVYPQPKTDPVIADLPISALERGDFLKVPILTGFSTNEGAMFVPAGTASDTDADFRKFFRKLIPGFSDTDIDELSALYQDPSAFVTRLGSEDEGSEKEKRYRVQYASVPPGKGPQWARLEAAYSDYAYICPVLQTAAFFTSVPKNLSNPLSPWKSCQSPDVGFPPPAPDTTFPLPPTCPPVYLYHYAALSGASKMAGHGDSAAPVSHDMRALDPHKERHPHPGLLAVSDAMHGAWSRFVATGEVSDEGLDWEPVTHLLPSVGDRYEEKREVEERGTSGAEVGIMVFGEGNDEGAEDDHKGTAAKMGDIGRDRMRKCRFWWPRAELSEGMGVHRRAGS